MYAGCVSLKAEPSKEVPPLESSLGKKGQPPVHKKRSHHRRGAAGMEAPDSLETVPCQCPAMAAGRFKGLRPLRL